MAAKTSWHARSLCKDFNTEEFHILVGNQSTPSMFACSAGIVQRVWSPGVVNELTESKDEAAATFERGEHYVRAGTLP